MNHTSRTISALIASSVLAASMLPLGACASKTPSTMPNGLAKDLGLSQPAGTMTAAESGAYDVEYIEYPEFNTEEYAHVDESGFVSPAANPLSTVSADVDTASYCNIRRMLTSGYAIDEIPTGAVRIEEMLNYFHYDYAAPTGSDAFSITATMGDCPWNADAKLLTLGFAAAPYNAESSAGSNLVFLIDVSGSMDSMEKLGLLQQAFEVLVNQLDENDRVSIVTYASEERMVLDGASGSEHQKILRAVKSLRANGSTNGERGLAMAYDLAAKNYIEGGTNRIIMASDGDLNVGITSQSDLHDFVAAKRDSGIYLSVLGFGSGNYKDTKMETLADHGNGAYHYIDCISEAQRVLSDNLIANTVPFADDVKVQVEFNPAQVKGYRLIGYDNREMADEDFENDAADAGEVGPGMQFTVAYEVLLTDSAQSVFTPTLRYGSNVGDAAIDEIATVSLRYRSFADSTVHAQQLPLSPAAIAAPNDDWEFAASVIEFGMLLRDSEYAGTASLDSVMSSADTSANDNDRSGFYELVKLAAHPIVEDHR